MDRFLKLWVESARASSSFDETSISSSNSNNNNNSPTIQSGYISRPPPLRTSSTYDDDDVFNNVALNLLSRHDMLGLTAQEAILATLFDHNQRTSFYEALCVRLERSMHLSPNTSSLVQCIHDRLGTTLKDLIVLESKGAPCCYTNKPITPRSSIGYCRNVKNLVQRRFFPEGTGDNKQQGGGSGGSTILFGSSKRRVQNIDWKLAEAIQQVNQLRLDGTSPIHQQQQNHYVKTNVVYEPPTSTQPRDI